MNDATTAETPVKRVLLKLSGESLCGESGFGIEPEQLQLVAAGVCELVEDGTQVALVIGAGNIFRGASLVSVGLQRVTADHIGMLGTVMNALALQDAIEAQGQLVRVMSSVRLNELCEEYIRRRAVRHLEKNRVVIFAAGTGNPFFTTDTAASLRAVEIEADLMLKATKVDGVYTADPKKDPDARRYQSISYDEALSRRLGVMDQTAIVMCRENDMPLRVIDMTRPGVLKRAVVGDDEGTLVHNGETILA